MFITFEGLDGCGKTTIIDRIKIYFKDKNLDHNFVFTREPGGAKSKESEYIRKFILSPEFEIDSMSEAILYLASRIMHIKKIINPALEQKKVVISDRFIDSSLAYQGAGRDLGIENIADIHKLTINNIKVDLTFYIKISPELSVKRINENRSNKIDRLEQEGIEFYKKIAQGYEEIIKSDPGRFFIIDGNEDLEIIFGKVIKKIEEMINTL